MNCNRCGKGNPANARHCVHCGNPLSVQNGNQADNIIVAIIVVLIVVLIVAAVVFVRQSFSPSRGFSGGGGGGGGGGNHPAMERPEPPGDIPGMILPDEDEEKETEEEKQRREEEAALKAEEAENRRFAQKDAFISEAARIQNYEDNFLNNAETDSAQAQEAKNVFNKWDVLLNEVYDYLKTILPNSEFDILQDNERGWIEKKEADMKLNRELNGETAEYLIGIDWTKDRVYYLISNIK